jgi:hypothetical protein
MKTTLAFLIGLALCAGVTHAQTTNAPVAIPSATTTHMVTTPLVVLTPAQVTASFALIGNGFTLPNGVTWAQVTSIVSRVYPQGAVQRTVNGRTLLLPPTVTAQSGDVAVPAGSGSIVITYTDSQ